MFRSPQKKGARQARPKLTPTDTYIRQTCAVLEGAADREAVEILIGRGVICAEQPSDIDEAIARLWNSKAHYAQHDAWFARTEQVTWTPQQKKLLMEGEELQVTEVQETGEAAYLLGIAVGRRLGSAPLKPVKIGGVQ